MRTEVIKADSIAKAAERILEELKEDVATRSVSTRNNVIYFDGWDGLGASAVLRAVTQRLTAMASSDEAPAGLRFDQIIHVDCSKWESRRSLQRAVAENLELPAPVMDMFDRQDEDDDYNGVAKDSRFEIPQVARKMSEHIQKLNHRFLVIFHNGSDEDVDLGTFCGFPLSGYSTNKVLWTFQGAFRLKPRVKVDDALKSTGATDVFLSASSQKKDPHELWNYVVHQDAADVARMITTRAAAETTSATAQSVSTYYIANYFLYMWKLCGMVHQFRIDYDMATHGSNYWICDGIMQLEQGHQADIIGNDCDDDGPWRTAAAVQQDLRLDSDYYHHSLQSLPSQSHLMRCADSSASMPYWTSPPHWVCFSTGDTLLQHFSKLVVLKLSRCTFSFSSPPFLCCSSLRFLWLDHCQDQVNSTDEEGDEEAISRCFKRLWVLDVRYTRCDRILSGQMLDFMTQLRELNVIGAQDLDMVLLHGRLPNICKLRVTKSTVRCSSYSKKGLFSGMNKKELLDFSGNRMVQGAAEYSEITTSNTCLETLIIIDGCVGIQKFSFRECSKLKNLLFSGLFEDLHILDLSGTAVKTLDLNAMTAHRLDEVILDNCDKLCAILWPPKGKGKTYLQKLHIENTQSASTSRSRGENMKGGSTATTGLSSWPMALVDGARAPSEFSWYICIKDARLLKSIVPSFENYFEDHGLHLEISSPSCCPNIEVGGTENEGIRNGTGEESRVVSNRQQQQQPKYNNNNASMYYADVATIIVEDHLLQEGEGNGNDAPTITRTRPCPPPLGRLVSSNCYLYTQDQRMKTKAMMDGGVITTIPSIICDSAYILHVHDSLYNTSIPGPAQWNNLDWCRVERCPRLAFIFTAPQLGGGSNVRMCWYLRIFWLSQLPRTRSLWDTSKLSFSQIDGRSFEDVTMLHLDFCPRLIHVFPFSSSVINRRYLVTLEIVWCGDLRVVFPLLDTHTETITMVDFPKLKRIHLHELPMLESICGDGRMYAPKLDTIKIRGCWSLKHLPAVRKYSRYSSKVECDCEKDWWDKLEWDGLDVNHHPSLYNPSHSRYYKKKLLRGSVLI